MNMQSPTCCMVFVRHARQGGTHLGQGHRAAIIVRLDLVGLEAQRRQLRHLQHRKERHGLREERS